MQSTCDEVNVCVCVCVFFNIYAIYLYLSSKEYISKLLFKCLSSLWFEIIYAN